LGFCQSQAIAFQQQAAIPPLQKKSCQKHYRRFFVRFGLCHNRRMNVEMAGRNEGCKGWTAVKRQPALRAKRLGVRNDSSAFGRRPESGAGARAPQPTGLSAGRVAREAFWSAERQFRFWRPMPIAPNCARLHLIALN
jgi:hypothetical protein